MDQYEQWQRLFGPDADQPIRSRELTTYVPPPTRIKPVISYRETSWAEQNPMWAALLCMLGALALGTGIAYLLVLEGVV